MTVLTPSSKSLPAEVSVLRKQTILSLSKVLVVFLALNAWGCHRDSSASSHRPRIGYVTNGVASFWTIAEAGAKAGGKAFDADVSVQMPQGIESQKRIVEDLITRGVDGIALSLIDPTNQASMVNDAAKRTTVITHDADAPGTDRLAYIGMDNYRAGRMCGELLKEAMPEGGTLMIFIGRVEQDNARRRRQGFIDELAGRSYDPNRYDPPGSEPPAGKYQILGTLTDQFDRAKGKANCEDTISRYPNINALVGLFAYNIPLCMEALNQVGKNGKVKLVAFDEAEETLKAIEEGIVYGTVVQDPYAYGYHSVRVLAALARGDRSVLPASGFLDIPARKIQKDNVAPFWADLKQKMNPSSSP